MTSSTLAELAKITGRNITSLSSAMKRLTVRTNGNPEVAARMADLMEGLEQVAKVPSLPLTPGMALLTSGLKITKTTEKTLESTLQTREGFCYIYAGDQRTLIFREGGLSFDYPGTALQPTRQANFIYLLEELRRRNPEAIYDYRLLK